MADNLYPVEHISNPGSCVEIIKGKYKKITEGDEFV